MLQVKIGLLRNLFTKVQFFQTSLRIKHNKNIINIRNYMHENEHIFLQGERISHCVQMWWYYLQGFQADLWNSLPPKIASNMYAKIFDHTYGILVGRYAKVDIYSL